MLSTVHGPGNSVLDLQTLKSTVHILPCERSILQDEMQKCTLNEFFIQFIESVAAHECEGTIQVINCLGMGISCEISIQVVQVALQVHHLHEITTSTFATKSSLSPLYFTKVTVASAVLTCSIGMTISTDGLAPTNIQQVPQIIYSRLQN